jgi:two-component system NtrC family sensor kinase
MNLAVFRQSLAWKLILSIGAVMALSGALFWHTIVRTEKEKIYRDFIKYSEHFTSIVNKTLRYGMLTVHKESIQNNVEAVSSLANISSVRILNAHGKIFYSSDPKEIGSQVDKGKQICVVCHQDGKKPLDALSEKDRWMIYLDQKEARYLKSVEPIYNEPACFNASCHVHPKSQHILGFLEMDFPLEQIDASVWSRTLKTITAGVIFFCILSFCLLVILWRLVSRPVSILAENMKKVAAGDLDHHVQINSNDEIAMLAQNFNEMISELARSRDTMNRWTQTLEEEVAKKTEEIQQTQRSLVQAEKLASLGRMAAGVAHELNNPLTGIITFAHLMLSRTPEENKDDRDDLNVIIEQSERCAKIIKGLLTFSRARHHEKTVCNINDVLDKTLDMIKTNEKFYHIKIHTTKSETALLAQGDASQFQQVFLNMLINAADAMNEKGRLTIQTHKVEENSEPYAEIIFIDTGSGIPDDVIEKIFDPFYTTKPPGKGTGLGLAVSHGIIKHHGGKINVTSKVGQGASFFIRLPLIKH